uniref:C2H2-type domain-containing protein n=1 Tax=Syphacia muris TaxID=451379 RepID=A0A0N5AXL8_9BILA
MALNILLLNAAYKLLGAMKNRLVVIIGCTGTGKSGLGIEIAKKFNGEIINADSMQLYKGLDIATNKVTEAEMGNVKHHMLGFLDPSCSDFNVFRFRDQVLKIIEDLWSKNKLPILVGGTSYYVESILYKDYLIPTSGNLSKFIFLLVFLGMDHLKDLSNDELYEYLKKIDKCSADQVHKNNRLRVVRAIEIYESTKVRKSEHLAKQKGGGEFGIGGTLRFPETLLFYLDGDQKILANRLDKRVEEMVNRGLRGEIEYSPSLSMYGVYQSIGLKEFVDYLKLSKADRQSDVGDELFKKGCDLVKIHTRQYAKRQRSWIINRLIRRQKCLCPKVVGKDKINEFKQLQIYHCDICSIDIQGTGSWEAHLRGRRHKAAKRKINKIEKSEFGVAKSVVVT